MLVCNQCKRKPLPPAQMRICDNCGGLFPGFAQHCGVCSHMMGFCQICGRKDVEVEEVPFEDLEKGLEGLE
jgi:hypothetical protein